MLRSLYEAYLRRRFAWLLASLLAVIGVDPALEAIGLGGRAVEWMLVLALIAAVAGAWRANRSHALVLGVGAADSSARMPAKPESEETEMHGAPLALTDSRLETPRAAAWRRRGRGVVRVRARRAWRTTACALLALAGGLVAALPADAQDAAPRAPDRDVAAEFTDPLTTLPQIFLQNAYTPWNYGSDANTNRLTARIAVPRVPASSLLPFDQLIRPSLSMVTVPTGPGERTRTELGDFVLFDLAVLPLESRKRGLVMGVGPVLVFPTATHPTAGQGAWQAGPAFGAIYKGKPGILLGWLLQNPISFAYTDSSRPKINTLLFQPIVMAYLGKGFYVKSGDSTWAFGWREGSPTILPVSLGLGYVMLRDGKPPLNLFLSGEWTVYRKNAPVAPQTSIRFGVSIAFPKWKID